MLRLVRLALAPDGTILPDVRAKAPGRGAWIGVTRDTLETAIRKGKLKGALARAFKNAEFTIPADLSALIEAALQRNALDRLGLEAKGGTLLTGSDKIETAARQGQLHALYHAADAGTDGNRKYRGWFVGMAPIDNPRIVVAVMIDEPTNGKYFGGDVAAPVFAETVQQTLRILSVQPDLAVKPQIVAQAAEENL